MHGLPFHGAYSGWERKNWALCDVIYVINGLRRLQPSLSSLDLKLKNKIEAFIEKQEAEYKSRALPLSTASAQPSPEINLDPANKSQDDAEGINLDLESPQESPIATPEEAIESQDDGMRENLHWESPEENPTAKFEEKTEASKTSSKASPKSSAKVLLRASTIFSPKTSPKVSPEPSPKASPNFSANNAALFISARSLAQESVDAMLDSLPPAPTHMPGLTEDEAEVAPREQKSRMELGQ
jgi:hypothetical protein